MSTPLLEVRDLHTVFHTARGDVHAVNEVSLSLAPGETLGIVGESGSGKSVLGRTIMGLISGSREVSITGDVTVKGHHVHDMPVTRRRHLWGTDIAMVFQDPMTSLNPVKKVGKHLTEALRLHLRMDRAQAAQRAVELLRQVGIPEPERRLAQYPHELSGGMRQRVVIAMALACGPDLLIADEPTTALDVTVQKQILDLLESLSTQLDMATILISHDLGVVAGRTDRVAVMYAGEVIESADTKRIFDAPRHPYTEALAESIPRLDNPPHTMLRTISGQPANLLEEPRGCRFAPRCRYAQDVCTENEPALTGIEAGGAESGQGSVACHFPLDRAAESTGGPPRETADSMES
ncbi:ABC transporter ATP-binding protein [Haloactinomyces albus]|uniref:Peptide/nickel transport system ATP-binding protein n=1 Tax=Haloactinomyces albus TaxID=1352928 RepID=A0AAE3ZFA4_9ACTN|nr:ABC transporter ATP-binding protein [Haloactinomyces albus]MDR7303842.1 peptide/nickel transport system ATP-binding protein [Haloactinomyces albus]